MSAELPLAELSSLLVDLSGMDAEEVEREGLRIWADVYLFSGNVGCLRAHDGQDVLFFAEAFSHAFYSSPERMRRPFAKTDISRERVERIHWIAALISGRVAPSACWGIVGGPRPRPEPRRLYAVEGPIYVVWLVPRRKGGFKFDTAYPARAEDLTRYTRSARRMWERK